MMGGKIKFPAPKNIENKVREVAISSPIPWGRFVCVVAVSVTILLLAVEVIISIAILSLRACCAKLCSLF